MPGRQDVVSEFGAQASKEAAGLLDKKARELRAQGEEEEAKKYEEGGEYRIAAHAVIGALSGDLSGALGAAASASMANRLNGLQSVLEKQLVSAGFGPDENGNNDWASGLAKLATGALASGIGAAAGGGVDGAAAGLNQDFNNRQLHPDERKWIEDNAKDFARKLGISEEEAIRRLAQQALRNNDVAWSGYLGDATDQAASEFLKQEGGKSTFMADDGSRQVLFTVKNGEQFDGVKYASDNADQASLNFYQQYVQPGKVNSGYITVLGSATWQGAKALPGKIADGVVDCSSQPLTCAKGVAVNLIPSIVDGFKDAGTSLGGAMAAALDETTAKQLTQLYGSANAPQVVASIAASPAAALVLPADKLLVGAGKVVEKGLGAAGEAWEAGKVLGAGEVELSKGGNISAQQITKEGTPAALNSAETTELAKLASLDKDAAGALRETVANSYFERNGFQALDGKCGSNCFDGVYIKGDQVIVNEVKPLNAD